MKVVIRKRTSKTKGTVIFLDIHQGGTRRQITLDTTSMKEAHEIAHKVEHDLRMAEGNPAPKGRVKLEGFIAEYLDFSKATKAHNTFRADKLALKALSDCIGNIEIADIKMEHIERFKMARLSTVSPASINVHLRHLKSAFSFAVRKGYLKSNPAAKVALIRIPQNNSPRFLTTQEIAALRTACAGDVNLLRMIDFALMTGMRRAEIAHVQWSDIDLERGQISVSNKPGFQTKSKRSRVIPINSNLRQMLLEMQAEEHTADSLLFRIKYWWFGKRFRAAAQRAGLPASITIHSLRHTFASHLVMQGVDLATIKAILGHSDIKVTMIYSHLSPGHLAQSVERLPY